jgi:hypothetical protein
MSLCTDVLMMIADFGGIDVRIAMGFQPHRVDTSLLKHSPVMIRHTDTSSKIRLFLPDGRRAYTLVYDHVLNIRQVWVPILEPAYEIYLVDPHPTWDTAPALAS